MKWQFNSFAQTDLGLVREGNEDSAIYGANLIAVADGMGGHAGGEVASAIAINALAQLLPVISDPEIDIDSREDLFLNITYEIDSQILEKSKQNPELAGMGTTLTALNISGNNVELLHIGDSRCYRYRDNKLEQLSYDHTVMQELLDQGRLTPEEVFDHPQRSLLTQALMGDSGLDPILVSYEIKADESILLSSGYGDVDCKLLNTEGSCRLNLSTGFGKLNIKGKELDIESTKKIQYGKGPTSVIASSSFGNVKIRFSEIFIK